MHPSERVRWVVETARAVLDERVPPDEAARAAAVQAEQLIVPLRRDRDDVTRHEAEAVATTLRLLAEQVADRASGAPSEVTASGSHLALAEALGRLAQALR